MSDAPANDDELPSASTPEKKIKLPSAPSPPRWRFVNEAKKSLGYSSSAAGTIVHGKSSEELGAKYFPPQFPEDVTTSTSDTEVGKLMIREWIRGESESLVGKFAGFAKKEENEPSTTTGEASRLSEKLHSVGVSLGGVEGDVDEERPMDGMTQEVDDKLQKATDKIVPQTTQTSNYEDSDIEEPIEEKTSPTSQTPDEPEQNKRKDDKLKSIPERPDEKDQRGQKTKRCIFLFIFLLLVIAVFLLGLLLGMKSQSEEKVKTLQVVGEDPLSNIPSTMPNVRPSSASSVSSSHAPPNTMSSDPIIDCPINTKSFSINYIQQTRPKNIAEILAYDVTWELRDACSGEIVMKCLPCPLESPSSLETILTSTAATVVDTESISTTLLPKPIRPGYGKYVRRTRDNVENNLFSVRNLVDVIENIPPRLQQPKSNSHKDNFNEEEGKGSGYQSISQSAGANTFPTYFEVENTEEVKEEGYSKSSTVGCLPQGNEYVFEVISSDETGSCCNFAAATFAVTYGDVILVEGEAAKQEYSSSDDYATSTINSNTYREKEGKIYFGERSEPCKTLTSSLLLTAVPSTVPFSKSSPKPSTIPPPMPHILSPPLIDLTNIPSNSPTWSPKMLSPNKLAALSPSISPSSGLTISSSTISVRSTPTPTSSKSMPPTSNSTTPPTLLPINSRQPILPIPGLTCTSSTSDFNVCIALDMSGSVCNQGTGFECNACQPTLICNSDETDQIKCCNNFRDVVEFSSLMVNTLGLLPSHHFFSIVQFATNATLVSGLTSSTSVLDSLEGLVFTGGRTNHADAISLCHDTFPSINGTKNIVLFITDGDPSEPIGSGSPKLAAEQAANEAKQAGTFILPVLIAPKDMNESLSYLRGISSDGSVFNVTDFNDLANLQESLLVQVSCQT